MAGIPTIEPYTMPTSGDIPKNTVDWRVEPDRSVLLIHDMQRYFLKPIPAEGPGTDLVRNAALLRKSSTELGVPVSYTAQPGGMTEQQRGLLKDFWGPGMRLDPADREIIEPLAPEPGDWIFTKWRYSAFFRSDLLSRMREHGRDQIVICGVYAHVGILATAIDAFTHDIQPFLVADAIADFSAQEHRWAVEYAARRCAMVLNTEEVFP